MSERRLAELEKRVLALESAQKQPARIGRPPRYGVPLPTLIAVRVSKQVAQALDAAAKVRGVALPDLVRALLSESVGLDVGVGKKIPTTQEE